MILVVSFSLLYGFFVLVFWQFSHNWTVCRAATTSEFCIACMIASQAILNINFIMLWVMSSSNVPPFVFYSWYQKRISDYISRLKLYSYFRRGGLEIGLIFFFIKKTNAKTVSWREDKCTEKFIMYLYNVGMVGWSMSHPETPYQVLCGDMSRKVPQWYEVKRSLACWQECVVFWRLA